MSEQALWAIMWLVAGFVVGFFACYLICERFAEERFEGGFRLGRAFGGFDDWFRENFGDTSTDDERTRSVPQDLAGFPRCPECGAEVCPDDWPFCPVCGKKIGEGYGD